MGRTYYAIKNTDTDDYWSAIDGGFVLGLDPCDLYTDHGAMLEQAQRLTLHYGPCIIIEQYTLHFAGILTISAERKDTE